MKKSGPWIPSVTVGVRKWLITNPDREGGDLTNQWPNRFFHSPYRGWPQGNDANRIAGYSSSPELIAALGSDPARRFGSDFLVKLNASGRDYLFTKALNDRVSAMAMNQKGEIYLTFYLTGFTLDRASRGPGVQPQNRLRRLFRTKDAGLALRSSKAGSE